MRAKTRDGTSPRHVVVRGGGARDQSPALSRRNAHRSHLAWHTTDIAISRSTA